jgi:hypothetical protein
MLSSLLGNLCRECAVFTRCCVCEEALYSLEGAVFLNYFILNIYLYIGESVLISLFAGVSYVAMERRATSIRQQ